MPPSRADRTLIELGDYNTSGRLGIDATAPVQIRALMLDVFALRHYNLSWRVLILRLCTRRVGLENRDRMHALFIISVAHWTYILHLIEELARLGLGEDYFVLRSRKEPGPLAPAFGTCRYGRHPIIALSKSLCRWNWRHWILICCTVPISSRRSGDTFAGSSPFTI